MTAPSPCHPLIHRPSGSAVARVVRLDGWWAKGRGVIGMPALLPGEGVWLPGVSAIHTVFVTSPLDLLFLDAQMRTVGWIHSFPPWRPLARASGAHHTIELGAGTFSRSVPGIRPGDGWLLSPLDGLQNGT